jgi:hypothetical protein
VSAATAALPVRLTHHSRERVAQRVGPIPASAVVGEIRAALADGRSACRKPSFLNQRRVKNHPGRGRVRFVWPESCDRAYVVRMTSDAVVVLTVEVPQ